MVQYSVHCTVSGTRVQLCSYVAEGPAQVHVLVVEQHRYTWAYVPEMMTHAARQARQTRF